VGLFESQKLPDILSRDIIIFRDLFQRTAKLEFLDKLFNRNPRTLQDGSAALLSLDNLDKRAILPEVFLLLGHTSFDATIIALLQVPFTKPQCHRNAAKR